MSVLPAEVLGRSDDGREHQHRGGDQPQIARTRTDGVFEQKPEHPDRNGADDHVPAQSVIRVAAMRPDEQAVEPGLQNPGDIAGEVDQHGSLGAELGDGGERCAGVTGKEDPGDDRQVSR